MGTLAIGRSGFLLQIKLLKNKIKQYKYFENCRVFVDIATCILIGTFRKSLYTCVLECLLILRFSPSGLWIAKKKFCWGLLCVVINGVICMTLIVFRTAASSVPLKKLGVSRLLVCLGLRNCLEKNRVLVSILLVVLNTVSLFFCQLVVFCAKKKIIG